MASAPAPEVSSEAAAVRSASEAVAVDAAPVDEGTGILVAEDAAVSAHEEGSDESNAASTKVGTAAATKPMTQRHGAAGKSKTPEAKAGNGGSETHRKTKNVVSSHRKTGSSPPKGVKAQSKANSSMTRSHGKAPPGESLPNKTPRGKTTVRKATPRSVGKKKKRGRRSKKKVCPLLTKKKVCCHSPCVGLHADGRLFTLAQSHLMPTSLEAAAEGIERGACLTYPMSTHSVRERCRLYDMCELGTAEGDSVQPAARGSSFTPS